MRITALLCGSLLVSLPLSASPQPLEPSSALIFPVTAVAVPDSSETPLPEDIASFKHRRDLCDHFRGEDPYDEERRKFLEENMRSYCTGTDKELASLKAKYKNNRRVMDILERYDEDIEGKKL